MKTRQAALLAPLIAAAVAGASCARISQEQLIKNEQSRLEQQMKRYPDRESSKEQKKAEEKAFQSQMQKQR